MKYIFTIIIVSLVTHISFGQKISRSQFVGTWEMIASDNSNTSYESVGSKLTVNYDGTAESYDPDVNERNPLSWRLDGDLLFLYVREGGKEKGMYAVVVSYTNGKLTLAESLSNPYQKNFVYRKVDGMQDAKVQISPTE